MELARAIGARATTVAAATTTATTERAATTTHATAAATGGATRRAAAGAARRGVGQTAGGKELLLTSGPNEVNAALAATKSLVYRHAPRSSVRALLNRRQGSRDKQLSGTLHETGRAGRAGRRTAAAGR